MKRTVGYTLAIAAALCASSADAVKLISDNHRSPNGIPQCVEFIVSDSTAQLLNRSGRYRPGDCRQLGFSLFGTTTVLPTPGGSVTAHIWARPQNDMMEGEAFDELEYTGVSQKMKRKQEEKYVMLVSPYHKGQDGTPQCVEMLVPQAQAKLMMKVKDYVVNGDSCEDLGFPELARTLDVPLGGNRVIKSRMFEKPMEDKPRLRGGYY